MRLVLKVSAFHEASVRELEIWIRVDAPKVGHEDTL